MEAATTEAIHLEAEQEIIALKIKRSKEESAAVIGSYQNIMRRLKHIKIPDAPRSEQERIALKVELTRLATF